MNQQDLVQIDPRLLSISQLKSVLDPVRRIESTRQEAFREGKAQGYATGYLEGRAEARLERLQELRKKAELTGRILVLKEILGLPTPTDDMLSGFDVV